MNIEDLVSKEELIEKVVERISNNILYSISVDDEGEPHELPSTFKKEVDKAIKAKIDDTITDIANKSILPRVEELVQGTILQETNKWGEAKQPAMTFTEYLVSRAESYMGEEVDSNGKSRSESDNSYSFRSYGKRLTYHIDKYLRDNMERAIKQIIENGNSAITKGLNDEFKKVLSDFVARFQIGIKLESKK